MKTSRLSNKDYFTIIIILFFLGISSLAEEQPVDIWNIDKNTEKKASENNQVLEESNLNSNSENDSDIFKMQTQKTSSIKLEDSLISKDIKIIGLYDPEDYDLDISMWINSDGDQLKNIFSKLDKINLSDDATEIMKISLLTNAHIPTKNITEKEFLKFKSDWLMKNSDLILIEEYLVKNQVFNHHPKLTKYLVDEYLSEANIEKACGLFLKVLEPINDDYLSKFHIYCLFNLGKIDEAQLLFDLKKELGFRDKYFENKINYLFGYTTKVNSEISEKNILDFHLAHRTNSDFIFEPKDNTSKIIWKYLSSSNLLTSTEKIETSELEKISLLEKATHNKNYSEKDLFKIYKRFQFNINQLLNAEQAYKSLLNIEARALIYQKILLESEMVEKLRYLKILKELFKKDEIGNAFDIELKKFLEKIDPVNIPDNLTSFYYTNIKIENEIVSKTKFNNDILHQSKLINYFNGDFSKTKISKDVNNFLKK